MTDSKLASFQRAIEAARTLMFQQAAAQKCVHPFRFMATNALNQVVWLAAVEIDDEEKIHIVHLIGPEWGLVEFPVAM